MINGSSNLHWVLVVLLQTTWHVRVGCFNLGKFVTAIEWTTSHLRLHFEGIQRVRSLRPMIAARLVVTLEIGRVATLVYRVSIDTNLTNLHSLGSWIPTILIELDSKLSSWLVWLINTRAYVLIPILLLVHILPIDAWPRSSIHILVLLVVIDIIIVRSVAIALERGSAIELAASIELSLVLTPHPNKRARLVRAVLVLILLLHHIVIISIWGVAIVSKSLLWTILIP